MAINFLITFENGILLNGTDIKLLKKQFADAWNQAAPALQGIPGLSITYVGQFACSATGDNAGVRQAVDAALQPPLTTQDQPPAPQSF